jgi:hypothetical protein
MLGELPEGAIEDARTQHRREMIAEVLTWIGARAMECHLDEAAGLFALAADLKHGRQGAPQP